ncbi:MAG: hypothetical protein NVS3B5_05340 [Sphingomicrobium sp.]
MGLPQTGDGFSRQGLTYRFPARFVSCARDHRRVNRWRSRRDDPPRRDPEPARMRRFWVPNVRNFVYNLRHMMPDGNAADHRRDCAGGDNIQSNKTEPQRAPPP